MHLIAGLADRFSRMSAHRHVFAFEEVIDEICRMPWEALDNREILRIAKAYYYFSVQFRENLEAACALYPDDHRLQELRAGECDTDNLSPWPGVAELRERLDHDEFMRRLLTLQPLYQTRELDREGALYLRRVRALVPGTRAASIASYEDGGLSRVFAAMLRAPHWHGPGQRAFRFFLEQHIRFDTDDDGGHGALSRHLHVDDAILPLWVGFRDLLTAAVPRFAAAGAAAEGVPGLPPEPLAAGAL